MIVFAHLCGINKCPRQRNPFRSKDGASCLHYLQNLKMMGKEIAQKRKPQRSKYCAQRRARMDCQFSAVRAAET